MDIDADPFLKYLIHRSKNLNKKIDKIKNKKIQQRESDVQLQEEEKKLLASRPTINTQLSEIEGIQKSYIEFLKSKKPTEQKVENDQSKDIITLWVLYEFLQNKEILSSMDAEDREIAEALLEMGNNIKGTPGESFEAAKIQANINIEKYLTASDSEMGLYTYEALNDFVKRLTASLQMVIRPPTPVSKVELSLESGEIASGNWKEPVEEEAPEEDPWRDIYEHQPQQEFEEEEAEDVVQEEEKKEEDDGFISVGKRQKPKKEPEQPRRGNKRFGDDSERRGNKRFGDDPERRGNKRFGDDSERRGNKRFGDDSERRGNKGFGDDSERRGNKRFGDDSERRGNKRFGDDSERRGRRPFNQRRTGDRAPRKD